MNEVAPDGSPVAIYLALPSEPELSIVREAVCAGASVLDLGSGPGRLANPLAAAGHEVTAVDDSAEMLHHVVGASAVLADVWQLDLGRRFDVVLATSHLINHPSQAGRAALLDVCRRHVRDGGSVLVQRYPPAWVPAEGRRMVGPVEVHLHDVEPLDGCFSAVVTYSLGAQAWDQAFMAAVVDDDELRRSAAAAGLDVTAVLDDAGAWVLLVAR